MPLRLGKMVCCRVVGVIECHVKILLLDLCLRVTFCCVINIMTKSNLRRKDLFLSYNSQVIHITKESQGRDSKKEPGGRTRSEIMEECCL